MTDTDLDSTDDGTDGSDGDPEKDSSPEEKADQRIRAAQAAMHKAMGEVARMESQIAAITYAQKPAEKDPLEDPEFLEKVKDDPVEALKYMVRRETVLREELAEVLAHQQMSASTKFRALDPAYPAVQKRVAELQADSTMKQFTDEQLFVIAKRELDASGGKGIERPRGAPTGLTGVHTKPTGESMSRKEVIEKDPILNAAYRAMHSFDPFEKKGAGK